MSSQKNLQHHWVVKESFVLAGRWVKPNSETYCRWYWHRSRKTLTVIAKGIADRKIYDFEKMTPDIEHLEKVLPDIALQKAERLRRSK